MIIDTTWEPNPAGIPALTDANDEARAVGKADPESVWDILRNGTDDEFSALINCIPEIGGPFDEDEALREIMRIGKRRLSGARDKEDFLLCLKVGFGCLFEQFWNEDN